MCVCMHACMYVCVHMYSYDSQAPKRCACMSLVFLFLPMYVARVRETSLSFIMNQHEPYEAARPPARRPPAARPPGRLHMYIDIYIYIYIFLYIGIGIPYWLFPIGFSLLLRWSKEDWSSWNEWQPSNPIGTRTSFST